MSGTLCIVTPSTLRVLGQNDQGLLPMQDGLNHILGLGLLLPRVIVYVATHNTCMYCSRQRHA